MEDRTAKGVPGHSVRRRRQRSICIAEIRVCHPSLRFLLAALFFTCALVFPLLNARAEGDAASSDDVMRLTVQTGAKSATARSQGGIDITGWQGAKNFLESFQVGVDGGFAGGKLRFLTNNCSVSPSTGQAGDTFTVTVTGAGPYTMTAIMAADDAHGELSVSRSGVAGKADQAPLAVTGWGSARDYYRTFTIQVAGGTTKGTVRFEADGCNVSPTSGNVNSVFTVTVTRVGSYSLTAIMDGNANYADARSARYTGMSGKAKQASVMIDGWMQNAYYGDSFPVKIAGGSTSEALSVTASGCEVVRDSGHNYTVTVTSVGPYSITASRAGNYGYNTESTSVCGVSKRAGQSGLSVSGWAESKNVADSFAIHVSGGMPGGTVHFATTGCTIKPESGTTETTYIVTIDTAGTYTLTARVDGDDNHNSASSRELKGTAGKAVQARLEVSNWKEAAPKGDVFDIAILGGSGTGTLSVSTNEGCMAMRKRGEDAMYTITVTANKGEEYALYVSKSGDASYAPARQQVLMGVAGKSAQTALDVNGWKTDSHMGDEFAIQIAGGSGNGGITFDAVGCKVSPETGDIDDVYQVVVTAAEGEAYSLSVSRAGDGVYANTSTVRSGSVRHAALDAMQTYADEALMEETETPLLGDGFDAVLLIGILLILLVIVAIALVLQQRQRRYIRR